MRKIIFLAYCILVGAGLSLHSDQNDFLESSFYNTKINVEDYFSTFYEDGISFFIMGEYIQAESIFSFILESKSASEEMRGAALWGRVWANACLGRKEEFVKDLDLIVDLVGLDRPCDCSSSVCLASPQNMGKRDLYFAKPLEESSRTQFAFCDMDYCLKTVDNCAVFMKGMCAVVKDSGIQFTLGLFIDGLAKKSKDCCRAGGFWRNCVQKMVDVMNSWKMLGIPADPAWD